MAFDTTYEILPISHRESVLTLDHNADVIFTILPFIDFHLDTVSFYSTEYSASTTFKLFQFLLTPAHNNLAKMRLGHNF